MNKSLTYIFAAALGALFVVPAFALAQVDPALGEPNFRADARAQLMASTTKEDMRIKAELRANAAMRLATSSNSEERMRNAKERAQAEIERRIAGLQRLLLRIEAMKRVSDSFKGELKTTVDAEIANIEALAAKIEAGTSTSTLKADIQSITKSYRIFALIMPQANIAAAAERIVTITATMGEIGAKLKIRIDEAAATAGSDTAALSDELISLSAHIDAANTYAEEAVEGTANLEPDGGDETVLQANQAALQAAREKLRLAHEEIVAGRANIKAIIDGLKALQPTSPSAADTSPELE